ncbi:MAG: OB-fold domain-containing protein [Chloroflexi bacterium]|nr:OB-fold domain-containing protein [Chloroflexota bacterium]
MSTGQQYQKPIPDITVDNQAFWEGCKRHEVLVQRCSDCGYNRIGSPICPQCSSLKHQWVKASGRGMLYSWIVVYQRYHPAFTADLPYNVAIVELQEGPRLWSNVVGVNSEELRNGMPLQVVFDDVTPEVTLAKFKPA